MKNQSNPPEGVPAVQQFNRATDRPQETLIISENCKLKQFPSFHILSSCLPVARRPAAELKGNGNHQGTRLTLVADGWFQTFSSCDLSLWWCGLRWRASFAANHQTLMPAVFSYHCGYFIYFSFLQTTQGFYRKREPPAPGLVEVVTVFSVLVSQNGLRWRGRRGTQQIFKVRKPKADILRPCLKCCRTSSQNHKSPVWGCQRVQQENTLHHSFKIYVFTGQIQLILFLILSLKKCQ